MASHNVTTHVVLGSSNLGDSRSSSTTASFVPPRSYQALNHQHIPLEPIPSINGGNRHMSVSGGKATSPRTHPVVASMPVLPLSTSSSQGSPRTPSSILQDDANSITSESSTSLTPIESPTPGKSSGTRKKKQTSTNAAPTKTTTPRKLSSRQSKNPSSSTSHDEKPTAEFVKAAKSSDLFEFLKNHGCYYNGKDPQDKVQENPALYAPTHRNMVGKPVGMLRVPDALYPEFLNIYTRCAMDGILFALSEQRSPVFRYHLDLDIKFDRNLTYDEILCFARIVQSTIRRFYPNMTDVQAATLLCVIITVPNGRANVSYMTDDTRLRDFVANLHNKINSEYDYHIFHGLKNAYREPSAASLNTSVYAMADATINTAIISGNPDAPITIESSPSTYALSQSILQQQQEEEEESSLLDLAMNNNRSLAEILLEGNGQTVDMGQMVSDTCDKCGRTPLTCRCTAQDGVFHVMKQNDEPLKNGIHVHFPKLKVNASQALIMRESIIVAMRRTFQGDYYGYTTWDDIIDECIYLQNGLRMTYSIKGDKCTVCKGSGTVALQHKCTEEDCDTGYIKGPQYKPLCMLTGLGSEHERATEKLLDNPFLAVKETSIRCPLQDTVTPGFAVYPGAPIYVPPHMRTKSKRTSGGTASATSQNSDHGVNVGGIDSMERAAKENLFRSDERVAGGFLRSMTRVSDETLIANIEYFINTNMGGYYREIEVRDVHYKIRNVKNNSIFYIVRVKNRSIGSSYCQNVCRNHTSSTIYFCIDKYGMSQKCFSRKRENTCREYKSPSVPLTGKLNDDLFTRLSCSAYKDHAFDIDLVDPAVNKVAHINGIQKIMLGLDARINDLQRMNQRLRASQCDSDDENEIAVIACKSGGTLCNEDVEDDAACPNHLNGGIHLECDARANKRARTITTTGSS